MQAVLCAVLAAVIGLAAVVQNYLRQRTHVALAPPQQFGRLSLCPPAGWQAQQRSSPEGVIFLEPTEKQIPLRRLEICASACPRSSRRPSICCEAASCAGDLAAMGGQIKTVRIAGWSGIMIAQTRLLRGADRRDSRSKQILSCAVLPSGEALVMRLEGPGVADSADEDLLRRIGESMKLQGCKPPIVTGSVELAGDIRIRLPDGLLTCAG